MIPVPFSNQISTIFNVTRPPGLEMVFRKGDLYARCIKIIGFRIHSSKIFKFHNEAKRAFPSVSINFLQIRMRQFSRRYIIILTLYNKRRDGSSNGAKFPFAARYDLE